MTMSTTLDSKCITSILLVFMITTTTMLQLSAAACNGTYCGWIKVSGSYPDVMPRDMNSMSVGYDVAKDTVLLIGGAGWYTHQLTTFDGSKFSDQGLGFLVDQGIYGTGQFYTQMDNRLYMIDYGGSEITFVNTETREYNNWPFIQIPINIGYKGCLASTKTVEHEYLFVVGGYHDAHTSSIAQTNIMDALQIYNISSHEWISSVPSMHTKRDNMACLVKNEVLYAIGGYANLGYQTYQHLDTIEMLHVGNDLMDIQNLNWKVMQGILSKGVSGCRAVEYGDYIIVIGGYHDYYYVTDINVIDTMTLTVQLDGSISQVMDKGLAYPGVIIMNDVLYVFGGDNGGGYSIDTYLKLDLGPSFAPTNAPTNVSSETAKGTGSAMNKSDMVLMISLITIGVLILLFVVWGAYRYYMKYVKKRNMDLQYAQNFQMDLEDGEEIVDEEEQIDRL